MRPRHQLFPAPAVVVAEAEALERLDGGVGIEDPHHHLLAEGGRQRRQPHLDLVAGGIADLDAAVERAAALDHVHPAEQLDARDHRAHHARRQLVDGVHDAVDAEADDASLAPRLEVDVGGALVEGVLPEPVDDLDHARVVGVELLVALAELDQLLEVGERRRLAHLGRVANRARERIELGRVAGDLDRVDEDQLDVAARVRLDLAHPGDVERLAGGDRHVGEAEGQRQRVAPLGVLDRHHVGDTADIDLERVDAHVGQVAALGQPLGQRLGVEHLAVADARQAGAADPHQRMLGAVAAGEAARGALDVFGADDLVVAQPRQHRAPGQLAVRDDVEREIDGLRLQRRRPRGRDRALEPAFAIDRAVAAAPPSFGAAPSRAGALSRAADA